MSVVMSMEEDLAAQWNEIYKWTEAVQLGIKEWKCQSRNTTASQVSMVEMNMEMSSLCLDASAVQVSPVLSTSENEWSMKRNDL